MSGKQTTPKRLSATHKQAEALRMRTAGKSLEEIAKALGYRDQSGAHRAIVAGLKKTLQEPADELRKMEAERLDRMLEGLWKKAIAGDTWSIDRVLGIMERRARLLGLDRPADTGDRTAEQLRAYLDFLDEARAAAAAKVPDMSEA